MRNLEVKLLEKPWGRYDVPATFGAGDGDRIGEAWFVGEDELPLLVKYLFTSERLSIQVHPNDQQARALGARGGKNECWYIVEAAPGATVGIGLIRELEKSELRAAAEDGSIEQLIHWHPVCAGSFFYVPSGTLHAIGAGVKVLEIQQNRDVTYRLYDYGRPRQLHVDEAISVASLLRYSTEMSRQVSADAPQILLSGPAFSLVQGVDGRSPAGALRGRRRWVIPVAGNVSSKGETAGPGACLLLEADDELSFSSARVLIAAEGPL